MTPALVARMVCSLAIAAPCTARALAPPGVQSVSSEGGEPDLIASIDGRNVHKVGNIWLNVTNFGVFGAQPGTRLPWSDSPSAQWPAPSQTEYLFGAGLWVGALIHGEPHVTTAHYDMEFRPDRGPLDRMYETHEGDEGSARAPAVDLDDDRDGDVDEDPPNGFDDDEDGRIDEDFAAISDQMFTCEYGDIDPLIRARYPDHRSLGLRVRQTTMAWGGEGKRDFIGMNFKITSEQSLQDVYLGIFADPDIGPPDRSARAFDDLVGFWEGQVVLEGARPVHVTMGYMWDADGDGIDSEGYAGFILLGLERTGFGDNAMNRRVHALEPRNFRYFSAKTAYVQGGDPTNDEERYHVLDGSAPLSLPASRPRDPIASRDPNDYRFVISAGPLGSLSPGDTIGITMAFVIGKGFEGLQQEAARAKLAFEGAWADCDWDPKTGVDGRETPHCGPEEAGVRYPVGGPDTPATFRVTPCESLCVNTRDWWRNPPCSAGVPYNACLWIDGDCLPSTGIDGKECLVHWFSDIPPPPPNMRLLAKENRVEVLFDNRSERAIDPVLTVPDFESYRIWRADGWSRPLGSDIDTGPPPGTWTLLGEFDLRDNGIGPETGLDVLRYRPNLPDWAVEFCREWDRAHPLTPPPTLHGLTEAQLDTAMALARGVRYYRFVDPPFIAPATDQDPPCRQDGRCDPIATDSRDVFRRCDSRHRCRAAKQPPRPGANYFYSVTATDHRMVRRSGALVPAGRGLAGDPQSNYRFINPPSDALQPWQYDQADEEIYVVPNPATPATMAAWALSPNNTDPSGEKIEFHHLPASQGRVSIFTLSGDLVMELAFDGRNGNGSAAWDLVSRNGQDVTSGVYLFSVQADDPRFKRFVGKFVVVR